MTEKEPQLREKPSYENIRETFDEIKGEVEKTRSKILRNSDAFKMLENLKQLFFHAPKQLIPILIASLPIYLSGCLTSIVNENPRYELSVPRYDSQLEREMVANPEMTAVQKRIRELVDFINTNPSVNENGNISYSENEEIYISRENSGEIGSITILKRNPNLGEEREIESLEFYLNGTIGTWRRYNSDEQTRTSLFFDTRGIPYERIISTRFNEPVRYEVIKYNGETLGTFPNEREKNSHLTSEEYLEMLINELDTSERLATYLARFMRYTPDAPNNEQQLIDHWQKPLETIERVENGKMLGDCEDYSFLAKEILHRQGKLAHVLDIPLHAMCAWVEQTQDGKYIGHILSLDNPRSASLSAEYSAPHKDFRTALQQAMRNTTYDYQFGDEITILDIVNDIEARFVVPIEVFIDPDLYYEKTREVTWHTPR